MLPEMRDVVASIVFEKRLSILREEFLDRALAGEPPGPEFWEEGEREVLDYVRAQFYGPEMESAVGGANGGSGGGGFENRTQKMVERAIVFSHRRLAELPWVGHPDFEAPGSAAPEGGDA
ncbi:MAG TPA: hypothetical protein VLL48_13020 [Longimicrobiales bacterium]|nr:hypothetical protein [Longimicrobiales bacterium]